MQFKPRTLLLLNGAMWLFMGTFLMKKGFQYLLVPDSMAIAPFIIAGGLMLGYFKGRYVLRKTAHRLIENLNKHPLHAPLHAPYDKKYFILVAAMIGLSISFSLFGISPLVRGSIDVTIGAALIHGSLTYFYAL